MQNIKHRISLIFNSKKIGILFIVILPYTIYCQPGTLDLSFGNNGVSAPDFGTSTFGSRGNAMAVQQDGKILVAGRITVPYGGYNSSDIVVARFNTNGSLDITFGTGGIVTTNLKDVSTTFQPSGKSGDVGKAIAILPNGKILVAGTITYDNYDSNSQRFFVIRYNSNGTVDNSFGSDGDGIVVLNSTSQQDCESIKIQPDGKIILGGQNYTWSPLLYRLNADGSLDNSFLLNGASGQYDIHGGQINYIYFAHSIALQSDGKIIQAGYTYLSTGGAKRLFVSRFNADGSYDFSFNGIGSIVGAGNDNNTFIAGSNDYGYSCAVQNDGKILIGGGTESGMLAFRLNSNGTVDAGFGTNGYKKINTVFQGARSIMPLSNGKIILAGGPWSGDFTLVGLGSNGNLDNTFGSNGITLEAIGDQSDNSNELVSAALIQTDGKILVAGSSSHYMVNGFHKPDLTLARFNGYGVSDLSENYTTDLSIQLHPNPVSNTLHIENNSSETIHLNVIDNLGRTVIPSTTFSGEIQLNVTSLHSGVYYVHLQGVSSTMTESFYKQ